MPLGLKLRRPSLRLPSRRAIVANGGLQPDRPALRAGSRATDLIKGTTATTRFQTWLVGVFAPVAVTLAAIEVSGVLWYSANQPIKEIGNRPTLGALRHT
jgi:hypothetical protein